MKAVQERIGFMRVAGNTLYIDRDDGSVEVIAIHDRSGSSAVDLDVLHHQSCYRLYTRDSQLAIVFGVHGVYRLFWLGCKGEDERRKAIALALFDAFMAVWGDEDKR